MNNRPNLTHLYEAACEAAKAGDADAHAKALADIEAYFDVYRSPSERLANRLEEALSEGTLDGEAFDGDPADLDW